MDQVVRSVEDTWNPVSNVEAYSQKCIDSRLNSLGGSDATDGHVVSFCGPIVENEALT
jgi:hypothetical protein